jgi:acyl carrier protein
MRIVLDLIIAQVHGYIVENFLFGKGGEELGPDVSLLSEGIIDSTGIIELVGWIEETYGITVADVDITPENLDSTGNIAKYIQQKTAGQPTNAAKTALSSQDAP